MLPFCFEFSCSKSTGVSARFSQEASLGCLRNWCAEFKALKIYRLKFKLLIACKLEMMKTVCLFGNFAFDGLRRMPFDGKRIPRRRSKPAAY